MDLADELRIEAANMIAEFGSDVVLKKADSNTYDIGTSKTITVAGAEVNLKAHIENFDSKEIGGLILAGDINCIIAWNSTLVFNIETDKIKFNDIDYSIVNINPIIALNKTITHEVQLRK